VLDQSERDEGSQPGSVRKVPQPVMFFGYVWPIITAAISAFWNFLPQIPFSGIADRQHT
jgi:hypothetical protein